MPTNAFHGVSLVGILKQCLAFVTKLRITLILTAIEANHALYYALLLGNLHSVNFYSEL